MDKIKSLFHELNIGKSTPLIISVSGGVDSMVLLDYLFINKYKIRVVHFNHQARISSKDDEVLISNYCSQRNINYHLITLKIEKGNFQEIARNLRYYHLKEIAKKYKTKFILTAHHLDDLAETVLMKITRGSNLYGYAGIHDVYQEGSISFVRPLLHLPKKVLQTYAKENNVLYLDDESNFENAYLRNRYRHTVMPILKQENPKLLEKVYSYHIKLAKAASFIRTYSKKFINNNIITIDALLNEDIVVIENTISILLEHYKAAFTYETIEKLIAILRSDKPNASYNLSNNKVFIKAYNQCYVINNNEKKAIEQDLDYGLNVLNNMKIITLLKDTSLDDKQIVNICYNKLKFPLKVRLRKNGDLLHFDYGSKKLKDYLIDRKIPKHLRDELLIITDSNDTILWIPELFLNETLGNNEKIFIKIGDKDAE